MSEFNDGIGPEGAQVQGHAEPGRKKSVAEIAKAALDTASASAREQLRGGSDAIGRQVGSAQDLVRQAGDGAKAAVEGVRAQAGDAVARATTWSSDRYSNAANTVRLARRRSVTEIDRTREAVQGFVQENPIMVGVVGFAAGLLIGSLLPATQRENEVLGPYADEAREQGLRYAQDVVEQGRHFVEENIEKGLRQAGVDHPA